VKEKVDELIEGELSYKIIGVLYKIYNTIGPGLQEKYYQRAIAKVFQKEKIPFMEQVKVNLDLNGIKIGRYFLDFVIGHRIVLEIKVKNFFSIKDIKQVLGYLKKSGINVGLLVAFTTEGIKIKRLLKGK
jgi:GxxExxY protein